MYKAYYFFDHETGSYIVDVYLDKKFIKNYIFKSLKDMQFFLYGFYDDNVELIYLGTKW